jgi:hypothetical protein
MKRLKLGSMRFYINMENNNPTAASPRAWWRRALANIENGEEQVSVKQAAIKRMACESKYRVYRHFARILGEKRAGGEYRALATENLIEIAARLPKFRLIVQKARWGVLGGTADQ